MSLEIITRKLGEDYVKWKDGESAVKKHRKKFFDEAIKANASKTLAQKTVSVGEFDSDAEARAYLERQYPAWTILKIEILEDQTDVVAILQENPEFADFTYLNSEDQQVYRRQVVEGSPILDDDWLKEADPDLWERITKEQTTRVLLPSDELSDDDLRAMQRYVHPAKPTIKLAPPRKAKEEELPDGDED